MSEEKNKKRIWDRLLMGAIIGGAIGSVLGASIAPKKGKETRRDIVEAVKEGRKSPVFFLKKLFKKFSAQKTPGKIPTERPAEGNLNLPSVAEKPKKG